MAEPDVTLTDYGLAVLCCYFAWYILTNYKELQRLKLIWSIFFASIVVASLAGGTSHGFFSDEATTEYRMLWLVTLLAMGVTSASTWLLVGVVASNYSRFKKWAVLATISFIAYVSIVLFYKQDFVVVILNYLPPLLSLMSICIYKFYRTKLKHFLIIALGIIVSLIAAYTQQMGLALHGVYFNHNATYHLIQAFGLCAIFVGAKKMMVAGGVQ